MTPAWFVIRAKGQPVSGTALQAPLNPLPEPAQSEEKVICAPALGEVQTRCLEEVETMEVGGWTCVEVRLISLIRYFLA